MSSYIAFELDALNKAPSAARAARVTEDIIIGGLTRMWAHCFREKTAALTPLQIAGFFSTDSDTVPALVAFGFLAHEADVLRVKGADRYLRVAEGRSKGGKASAGNLIPGGRKVAPKPANPPRQDLGLTSAAAEPQPRPQPSSSRESCSADPRLTLGLSPTTDYRLPTTESKAAAAGRPALATADGWWLEAQDRRERIPGMVRETPPKHLGTWFSEAMSHVGGDEQRLMAGYDAFLVDPFWRNEANKRCHWGGWVSQWRDFVSRGAAPVPRPSKPGAPVQPSLWSTTTSTTISESL